MLTGLAAPRPDLEKKMKKGELRSKELLEAEPHAAVVNSFIMTFRQ